MPIFFICFIVFIIWLRVKSHSNDKQSSWDEAFWQREHDSNFVRKKDISHLDYLQPELTRLPFEQTDDSKELSLQENVKNSAAKKMLNLNNLSNTDIKLTYGTANLEILSTYDQNFSTFIRNLNEWGCYLYDNGKVANAKKVFLYALDIGSDISKTYVTLAKIYCREDAPEKIEQLLDNTENLNPLLKESIEEQLRQILLSCYQ